MKERDTFHYIVNDINISLDIKGVVVYIIESYYHDSHWYVEYLCYMQNKLFILVENGSRGEDEIGSFEEVSYHIERILTDYTSIPELDGLIYESNSENNFIMIS